MSKSNSKGIDKSKYKSFISHKTNHFKKDCPNDEGNDSSFVQVAIASYDDSYESVGVLVVRNQRRVGSSTRVSCI